MNESRFRERRNAVGDISELINNNMNNYNVNYTVNHNNTVNINKLNNAINDIIVFSLQLNNIINSDNINISNINDLINYIEQNFTLIENNGDHKFNNKSITHILQILSDSIDKLKTIRENDSQINNAVNKLTKLHENFATIILKLKNNSHANP